MKKNTLILICLMAWLICQASQTRTVTPQTDDCITAHMELLDLSKEHGPLFKFIRVTLTNHSQTDYYLPPRGFIRLYDPQPDTSGEFNDYFEYLPDEKWALTQDTRAMVLGGDEMYRRISDSLTQMELQRLLSEIPDNLTSRYRLTTLKMLVSSNYGYLTLLPAGESVSWVQPIKEYCWTTDPEFKEPYVITFYTGDEHFKSFGHYPVGEINGEKVNVISPPLDPILGTFHPYRKPIENNDTIVILPTFVKELPW